jgi:type I restriction enzyme M protein
MAKRLLFSAKNEGNKIIVTRKEIEFEWVGGFARSQKIKRLTKFREKLSDATQTKHLEVSSGSDNEFGKQLSAFNIRYSAGELMGYTVESVYQGSKIFSFGGPYQELYDKPSIVAKKDSRIRSSEPLIGFRLLEDEWPILPPTGFYNYLYFLALIQNSELISRASKFEYFSDMEFNHEKAVSCQAESLAIFFALYRVNLAEEILQDKSDFLNTISEIEFIEK